MLPCKCLHFALGLALYARIISACLNMSRGSYSMTNPHKHVVCINPRPLGLVSLDTQTAHIKKTELAGRFGVHEGIEESHGAGVAYITHHLKVITRGFAWRDGHGPVVSSASPFPPSRFDGGTYQMHPFAPLSSFFTSSGYSSYFSIRTCFNFAAFGLSGTVMGRRERTTKLLIWGSARP